MNQVQRLRSFAASQLSEASTLWGVSERTVRIIALLPLALMFLGALTTLGGRDAYVLFVGEDGIAENLQVIFALAAGVFAALCVRPLWQQGQRLIAVLYVVFALGMVFLAGEEISWGQRIFGWETPEHMLETNRQGELNIHNLNSVEWAFKWGQLLIGLYGTAMPFLLLGWDRLKPYRSSLAYLTPHSSLLMYFLPLLVWRIYRTFGTIPQQFYFVISEYNEVMELVLYFAFLAFMAYQWRSIAARTKASSLTMSAAINAAGK
ncbi:MAG TPA: hypothetical protein PKD53_24300 [Chloroflexaceae bacterium]|nr:hypothetical protein [Chloroflexaceae bacterium]